jgi:hypothetical protein
VLSLPIAVLSEIALVTSVILSEPEQLFRIHPMYVCKNCNSEIEKPKAWLWRKYCPTGHRLLNDAVVQSFWGSFARTFGSTFFLSSAALLGVAFNSDFVGGLAARRRFEEGVGGLFGFVLIIIFVSGLRAFYRANSWKKRGGAVHKLIPRARGKGFGYLSAASLLAIYLGPAFW